jgi:hypothetical protein
MKSVPVKSHAFEFCFPLLDHTQLRVVEEHGEVVVRATSNSFSEARKLAFISELAAEGFIPHEYRWGGLAGVGSFGHGVRRLLDSTWLELDQALIARTRRWTLRLLPPSTLLWALMIALVYPR